MLKPKVKILYVEDDILLNEITSELLISEGFDCVSTFNGLEAKLRLEKEDFDLLLTDFKMPHMNGAELLFWCRKNGKHLPVIFLSGNFERVPIEDDALKDCCAAIMIKPVAFDDLLVAITHSQQRSHEFECHGVSASLDDVFPGLQSLEKKKVPLS